MTIRLISGYNVRLSCWKFNSELGSFAQAAIYLDGAAHLFDRMLDDGEAQAGAAHGARSRFVNAIEALEDARQVLGWDSDAGVADQDADLSVLRSHFDLHFAIWAIELDGVIEQIDEDLFQPQFMADDLYVFEFFAEQCNALQARGGFHGAEGGFERGADGDRVGRRGGCGRLQFRERQKIRGDVTEAGGLRQDHLDKAAVILQIFEAAVEQRFRVAADGGQRGSQLMRDIGDKI